MSIKQSSNYMGLDYYLEVFYGYYLGKEKDIKIQFDNIDDLDGQIWDHFGFNEDVATVIQNGNGDDYDYYLCITKKYNSYSYRGKGNHFTPNPKEMELTNEEIDMLNKINELLSDDKPELKFYIVTDFSY